MNRQIVLNPDYLKRISEIGWFHAWGKSYPSSLEAVVEVDFRQAKTVAEAIKSYKSGTWSNTTLEARNILTSYLSANHRNDYRCWNPLVDEAKKFMEAAIYLPIQQFQARENLDDVFLHCVYWDVLAAIMENAYSELVPPPLLGQELIKIYEAGHFPCGWRDGLFPQGRLLIY